MQRLVEDTNAEPQSRIGISRSMLSITSPDRSSLISIERLDDTQFSPPTFVSRAWGRCHTDQPFEGERQRRNPAVHPRERKRSHDEKHTSASGWSKSSGFPCHHAMRCQRCGRQSSFHSTFLHMQDFSTKVASCPVLRSVLVEAMTCGNRPRIETTHDRGRTLFGMSSGKQHDCAGTQIMQPTRTRPCLRFYSDGMSNASSNQPRSYHPSEAKVLVMAPCRPIQLSTRISTDVVGLLFGG